MKKRFDIYTLRLIKDNGIYLFLLLIFIILLFGFIPLQINHFFSLDERNKKLNQELTQLKNQQNLVINLKSNQLDQAIKTINTLVPNSEDFFSIITALETISSKTGFSISQYRISLADISKQSIPIEITGVGGTGSIVNFLNGYHFSGGRLITITSLEYSPSVTKLNLVLNFHNFKPTKTDIINVKFDQQEIDKFVAIGETLSKDQVNQENLIPGQFNYPVRGNPFGQ